MVEKWLQLLKDVAPRVMRVGLMQNPQNADWPGYNAAAFPTFGVELMPLSVIQPAEIELAIRAVAENPYPGLIVLPDAFLIANIELLIASTVAMKAGSA